MIMIIYYLELRIYYNQKGILNLPFSVDVVLTLFIKQFIK